MRYGQVLQGTDIRQCRVSIAKHLQQPYNVAHKLSIPLVTLCKKNNMFYVLIFISQHKPTKVSWYLPYGHWHFHFNIWSKSKDAISECSEMDIRWQIALKLIKNLRPVQKARPMKPLKFQIVIGPQNKDPKANKVIDNISDGFWRKHEKLHVRWNMIRHDITARGLDKNRVQKMKYILSNHAITCFLVSPAKRGAICHSSL